MTSPLGARKASLWNDMQDITSRITAEKRSLTQEEINQYDALEAELETVSKSLMIEGRQSEREDEFRAKPEDTIVRVDSVTVTDIDTVPERRYADAFSKWTRYGTSDLEKEERSALRAGFVSGTEFRAQGVGTATAGGYAVPAQFRQELVEVQKVISSMRAVSTVITTDTGAQLPWPTLDDTSQVGAILAENTAVTEQDVALGQGTLDAYMYTSKLVRVSLQLIQDAGFPIDSWLPRVLGERIARAENAHFTTGTGTAQPLGIQTNAVSAVTLATGNTTSMTYAGLISVIEALDPIYRANAAWMTRSASAIRSMVDTTNRPLWEPSLQAGTADSLLGYPVIINTDMPAAAASVKSVLFGDFRAAYVIRDVTGVQTLRLEERYADFLQVAFLLFQRSGGTLQQSAAVRAVTQSAT